MSSTNLRCSSGIIVDSFVPSSPPSSTPTYFAGTRTSTPYGRSPTSFSIQSSSMSSCSGVKATAPSTPMPPALLTAATTSRQWLKARIGNSMPRRSQTGVRMDPSLVLRLPALRLPRPLRRARGRSTLSTVSTKWNVISSRTFSGTSSMSASLRAGRITSVSPARWAASTFCFTPPIGSTRPDSVTSPVIPTSLRTGRCVSSDTSAVVIVMPADGPSFGTAPAGKCTWNRFWFERRRIDAELARPSSGRTTARSAPTPSSRHRAGR